MDQNQQKELQEKKDRDKFNSITQKRLGIQKGALWGYMEHV